MLYTPCASFKVAKSPVVGVTVDLQVSDYWGFYKHPQRVRPWLTVAALLEYFSPLKVG